MRISIQYSLSFISFLICNFSTFNLSYRSTISKQLFTIIRNSQCISLTIITQYFNTFVFS